MNSYIFLCFCLFAVTNCAKFVKKEPLDYNLEVDKTLDEIENAVRNQSESDFVTNFSENFDAEDWYRKFIKFTSEQAETYSISRFGDVKDEKSVQFTESVRMNETFVRHTAFDAIFTEIQSENGTSRLVIDSLTVHDEKTLEPDDE